MPAAWAFDGIKRFSTLDTLDEEGSDQNGKNKGRGLYKHVQDLNDQNIENARRDIESYKKDADDKMKDYENKMKSFLEQAPYNPNLKRPEAPKLGKAPAVPAAEKIPDNLSGYINFLHPWGNILLDPFVLMVMFFGLVLATIITLRAQDIL